MSERQEKLAIAAAKSTGGRARASLVHLERRWGRLHRKAVLSVNDRILLEPMGEPELWRVTSTGEDGVWLEQEDVMAYLRLIQGEGKPERQCTRCGEKWDGEDDKNHGAHNRQAACSHMGVFNCQLEMIASYCSCPPSGPAYPRQPHEAKYEMDTAGNMRKVAPPAPTTALPAATDPAPAPATTASASVGGFDSGIIQLEPTDHREEVGGFKRGDQCAFQHRFNKDGVCNACGTKVPEGCTCAPAGSETIGYTHAPSCQLQPAKRSLDEIITTTADQAAALLSTPPPDGSPAPDVGAVLEAAREVVDQVVVQAMDQAGIPREALAGPPDGEGDQLSWVTVDADGMGCQRCGLWTPVPDDPAQATAALAAFEGEHLFCPEKQG